MDKVIIPTSKNPLMMPVVVISTVSPEGVKNFCSIAWITKVNSNPPLVMFALGPHKKTYKNIMESKVYGINIPNRKLIDTIDYCGLNSGNTTVKDHVYTTFEGSITHAPLIEECPVTIECELWKVVETPKNHLVIGEMRQIYADNDVLVDGNIDIAAFDPVLHAMAGDNIYFAAGEKTDDAYQKRTLS